MAEMLSSLLEAEAQREAFMRFIAAPMAQRDEILAVQQGRTVEQVQATLNQVQQVLALPAESRQAFWLHLANAGRPKSKPTVHPPANEAAWPAWLTKTFGAKRRAVVMHAFEQLNPGAPWQLSDLRILFTLFGALNLSTAAYNRHAPQPVDFSVLFQAEYEELIDRYQYSFEQLLFIRLQKATLREQKRFEAERLAYRNLRGPALIPLDYKPELAFQAQVQARWLVDVTAELPGIDLPEVAAGHEMAFIERAGKRGFEPEYIREFLDKTLERRSLLFFGGISALLSQLPTEVITIGPGTPIKKVFTVGDEDVAYEGAGDLLKALLGRWVGHDTTIHPLRIQALPKPDKPDTPRGGMGSRPPGWGRWWAPSGKD
jgi:hypothetical protein